MEDLSNREIRGYRLQRLIGAGGFGAIYLAEQPVLNREVAIKIIQPEYANHPEFIRRFAAEAQIIARLEHLHIVPLYDYWREPGGAYLVMRYLRGGDLHTSLTHGPWEPAAAVRLLDQMAAALAAAHRIGVVHQDVKPSNILLDDEQNAYLTDFGIAKDLFDPVQAENGESYYGSPLYMSPEAIRRKPVSPRSDIYSLGIVLYQALTGRVPFVNMDTSVVIRQQVSDPVPPVQLVRPGLPPDINLVIRRATAKSPDARYADAVSFAADFRRAMGADSAPAVVRPAGLETIKLPDYQFIPPSRTVPLSGPATVPLHTEPLNRNPYKGLRPFTEADEADFFGREALITDLLNRLRDPGLAARFLAVVGPSGSGKSSVVHAGLTPALRDGMVPGSGRWFITTMTPGADPFVALEAALVRVALDVPTDLRARLLNEPDGLYRTLPLLLPARDADMLLVIDQFEELFTLVADEAMRTHFLASLHAALTAGDSRLRVVITLRADFYDRPLLYPEFGELVQQHTAVVLPLNAEELGRAISQPAERAGLVVEEELVTAMVSDVNRQPGALPLLQYALTELAEDAEDSTLTLAAYQSGGEISGMLARRADLLYGMLEADEQDAARQVFLRLVAPDSGLTDTRQRVSWRVLLPLSPVVQTVLDRYGMIRLLTFDRDPQTREPTAEIAHEALIRRWDRLQIWLNDSRETRLLQGRLSAAVVEWQDGGRDAAYLASGGRLAQFERLLDDPDVALNPDERAYLEAGIALRGRRQRQRQGVIVALAVLTVLAVLAALFAVQRAQVAVFERDRADQQAAVALSRALAVTALTSAERGDLALLLGVEALHTADTVEAENSLLTALQAHPGLLAYLHGDAGRLRDVAFSPDGTLLAAAGQHGAVLRWDVVARQPAGEPLTGHTDRVNRVVFSPDGTLLASAGNDGAVRLWDAASGAPVGEPLVHPDSVWAAAFSPDGTLLATGGSDGLIRLWAVDSGQLVGEPLVGHMDAIYALAFSPDGRWLASGGGDNVIRLWDASTRQVIGEPLAGHSNWVFGLAFSPDGMLLASGGADGTLRLWELPRDADGELLPGAINGQAVATYPDWVRAVRFSPDGAQVAAAVQDGTVRRWSVLAGQELPPLVSGPDALWGVAFSPNGALLASGGVTGDAQLWALDGVAAPLLRDTLSGPDDPLVGLAYSANGRWLAAGEGNPLGPVGTNSLWIWDRTGAANPVQLDGQGGPINAVSFAPGSDLLATAQADGSILLWRLPAGTGDAPLAVFSGHSDSVFGVAFSPDGTLLASGSDDGTVRLWNVASGEPAGEPLVGHTDGVLAVAFSPDGAWLASGGRDGTVRLWNVATGEPLAALAGHTDMVQALAFSPDGVLLASGGRDETVRLWNVATGDPLAALEGHSDWVGAVAFSPDGMLLASASADGAVQLWGNSAGGESWRPVGEPLPGPATGVNGLAFSSDGAVLAAAGADGQVGIWQVAAADWVDRACTVANRVLTVEEWAFFLPDQPYTPACVSK